MKIIFITIFSLICIACFNIDKQTKYVSIEIINNSYCNVDTVSIQLNNYRRYIINIEKGDTILIYIDNDSIKTYGDFHFDCWVYFKTHVSTDLRLSKHQLYYTDLGGMLYEKYTITFKKDTSIDISPQYRYISN